MIKKINQQINSADNFKKVNARHDHIGDDTKYIPKPYVDIAKGMEAQFADFMINQMKSTINRDDSDSDAASKYYDSIHNSEIAKIMSNNNGGLGIQKEILNQIYPQRLRNEIAFRSYQSQVDNQSSIKKQNPIKRESSHE